MTEKRYIADTTLLYLADGLTPAERLSLTASLDRIGVNEIISPICTVDELKAYKSCVVNAHFAVCVGMDPKALASLIDAGVRVLYFEIPASNSLIYSGYGKNKDWVKKTLAECGELLRNEALEITVGLSDASRAEPGYIDRLVEFLSAVKISKLCLRDTMGIHSLSSCAEMISGAIALGCTVCYDGCDTLGMALPNTIQALRYGAKFACCSIAGAGGNCDIGRLLLTTKRIFSFDIDRKGAEELERTFRKQFKFR